MHGDGEPATVVAVARSADSGEDRPVGDSTALRVHGDLQTLESVAFRVITQLVGELHAGDRVVERFQTGDRVVP